MGYKIYTTPVFRKLFKKLDKKYPSLKADLQDLIQLLKAEPETGIHLGHNIYKIRMSISSKGKGKSGGARVLTYLVTKDKEIYLVYIYDKSQLDNISKEQILELLNNTGLNK